MTEHDYVIIYDPREELIKVLAENDPVAISNVLTAEGWLSPQLMSEILTLGTNKRQAQKLADHILREKEIHPEWYRNFLCFLSRHKWLTEIATILNDIQCGDLSNSHRNRITPTYRWTRESIHPDKKTSKFEEDSSTSFTDMDSVECDGPRPASHSIQSSPVGEPRGLMNIGNVTPTSPTTPSGKAGSQDLDSMDLHKLCRIGRLDSIRDIVQNTDPQALSIKLATQKGVFGYTVLHEAVASKNTEILDYLLEQTEAASVNSAAKSGYTPLHMAASSGLVDSVRVLLKHNADVNCTDEYGRTPRSAARLSSKRDTEKLLFSEELIKELEKKENGGRFKAWLQDKDHDCLFEPDCLKRALLVATRKDSDYFIGLLVEKGAKNLDNCLRVAVTEKKPKARAIFLLIKAAKTGNAAIIKKLYKEQDPGMSNESWSECEDEGFSDVQQAVLSGRVSTVVPIKIARRSGQTHVREQLLMKTNVSKEGCYVRWHGLQLLQLEVAWLKKIPWVRILIISSNGLRSLPNEMETYLKKVVKIHLQNNSLTSIPQCLMELPNLEELNLSNNKLQELPKLSGWSPSLASLDLSYNQLSSINPRDISAPALRSLNLAKNRFRSVPICVCSFTTLQILDLSENPDIMILPPEMGQLSSLFELNMKGLNDINDPPKSIQKDPVSCIHYLNNKRRCPQSFYRMKLMLVGCANRGKTTLVACLQGKRCGDESTVGIDISEWSYRCSFSRPTFHFSIWDFGGQEEYYATHQCFLSQESLYLLLFNLRHGREGVKELQPWLNNLALRVPKSCVIIVGTHLDEMRNENVGDLLAHVNTVAEPFQNRLQIVDVLAVGLKNSIKNVSTLKNAIYNHAANYRNKAGEPIMGRSIPASYHALDKELWKVQQEVRRGFREPVMHLAEFKEMVYKMKSTDIQDDEELKTATLFLTDVGSLLHYDDRRHNLHELYFIDPRWLCDMMATVITVKERNSFIQQGILHKEHLPFLFKDQRFLQRYFNQYLTLLDQFEIAIPLSHDHILVPSMLPEETPDDLQKDGQKVEPVHSRYIIFNSANTPPGFWSRLLSRIMHSIPKISSLLQMPSASVQSEDSNTKSSSFSATRSLTSVHNVSDHKLCSKRSHSISQVQLPATTLRSSLFNFTGNSEIQLHCWRTGLHYKDPDVMFRIESLSNSTRFRHKSSDGVVITVSNSSQGKKIMCKLSDLVVLLVAEWYPGLKDKRFGSTGLEQRVPCFECTKLGVAKPFEFDVQECLTHHMSKTAIKCGYYHDDPSRNHTVLLTDIVPDALLEDIDQNFLFDADELNYCEDEASFLGRGSYGKVYRGTCRGKSVAVKKFIAEFNEVAYNELRSEAKLLQHLHHPCLVCLVGVCISLRTLVLEEAPLKSLEYSLLEKKISIHRLTIFRIAAQVAAALQFLHSQGIIFRDLKAANVLLWSLDPDSLCHCKVSDFSIASHLPLTGTRGKFGTKGFMAPEVLSNNRCSIYDEKADIFSFSMFLYQLITRRYPSRYHPLQGERPKFHDVDIANTGYYYLTQLMKDCWNENPRNRPSTDKIIKRLSSSTTQAVMCITPVKSQFSLRQGIIISPAVFAKAGHLNKLENELWICCDGPEGMELNVYNTHTMAKLLNQPYFKENQFSCMALCGDHVWICSRSGVDYGVIDVFSIDTHKSVHNIQLNNVFISCIASTDEAVFVGTNRGYCFSFPVNAVKQPSPSIENKHKRISHNPIKGIACTRQCVWVSQAKSISFVDYDNLEIQGDVHREDESAEDFIGELSLTVDGNTIWSAHVGGTMVSAWHAHDRCLLFDIRMSDYVRQISSAFKKQDFIITAMSPALDTIWIGTGSGHILVFHNQEFLTWHEPYQRHVCFLTCVASAGPCGMENCIVASGGRNPKPVESPVDPANPDAVEGGKEKNDDNVHTAGTLIMWEAYEAMTMRQVKIIEKNSPEYLDNHATVRKMISEGKFTDGTSILLTV